MISYPISARKLWRKIIEALPATLNSDGNPRANGASWRHRAAYEARKCATFGKWDEKQHASIWKELKVVFKSIQGDGASRVKCAYCERHLSIQKNGLPDGHIDHFRPKGAVAKWESSLLPDVGGDSTGYYLLSYNPCNYVLVCTVCNRDWKKCFFPTKNARANNTIDVATLQAESPYLVHPLATNEPKLEEIIGFQDGIVVTSVASSGSFEELRAKAMIEVFQIDRRDDLRNERIKVIREIYNLKKLPPEDPDAIATLRRINDRFEPHYNCAQCYLKLWDTDPDWARQVGEELRDAYPQNANTRIR